MWQFNVDPSDEKWWGQMGACSNPKWLDVRECIEAEEAPGVVIVIDARPKPRHRCILYIGRTSPEEVPTYQSWMFQMLPLLCKHAPVLPSHYIYWNHWYFEYASKLMYADCNLLDGQLDSLSCSTSAASGSLSSADWRLIICATHPPIILLPKTS